MKKTQIVFFVFVSIVKFNASILKQSIEPNVANRLISNFNVVHFCEVLGCTDVQNNMPGGACTVLESLIGMILHHVS